MSKQVQPETQTIATNRKAKLRFDILETFEAGLVLKGSEVKQLREKRCNIEPAFIRVRDGELWLIEASIPPREHGGYYNHEEKRSRKLLMHRTQIEKVEVSLSTKGHTCVPMRLYFKDGKAKAEIALVKGRSYADEREAIKERETKRELAEAVKRRFR